MVSLPYDKSMSINLLPGAQDWRQSHLGRLLGHAMRRFDERVLALMAQHIEVPLALAPRTFTSHGICLWRAHV